ncbi:hypothetical protein L249_7557 [Ophiocordyceps polyrhachis-furcata BCC 54312]|uniref:Uncharacterized protein n=1 Tax=Ophiocordyceps polyrhachis-furcata BCC 54312 TaxID=1330021 RepID=A0A367LBN4_9HYPO|nr:hypothetical protein L249_7557 [Ophiocordyceps polyrhachis-furcata BCC 54312]
MLIERMMWVGAGPVRFRPNAGGAAADSHGYMKWYLACLSGREEEAAGAKGRQAGVLCRRGDAVKHRHTCISADLSAEVHFSLAWVESYLTCL